MFPVTKFYAWSSVMLFTSIMPMENQTIFPVIPSRGRFCVAPCPYNNPLELPGCETLWWNQALQSDTTWKLMSVVSESSSAPSVCRCCSSRAGLAEGAAWLNPRHGCQGSPGHRGRRGCYGASGTGHICCCCGHRHRILILKWFWGILLYLVNTTLLLYSQFLWVYMFFHVYCCGRKRESGHRAPILQQAPWGRSH